MDRDDSVGMAVSGQKRPGKIQIQQAFSIEAQFQSHQRVCDAAKGERCATEYEWNAYLMHGCCGASVEAVVDEFVFVTCWDFVTLR